MADIELVIKISEVDFERCKKRFKRRIEQDIVGDAIATGTPLEDILVEFADWYDVPFGHDQFMSLPECGVKEFLKQRGEKIG